MENTPQIFENSKFGKLTVIERDGEPWFVGSEVAGILGYKYPKDAIRDNCKYAKILKRESESLLDIPPRGIQIINETDLYNVITSCQKKSSEFKEDLFNWLFTDKIISEKIMIKSRKEIEFLHLLEGILEPFGISGIKQYQIENYKIDFYIPELKIAIEYDENSHGFYKKDKKREKEIKKELNCKFIRVSDKDSDAWNCGYIVKQIYSL